MQHAGLFLTQVEEYWKFSMNFDKIKARTYINNDKIERKYTRAFKLHYEILAVWTRTQIARV